MKKRFFLALLLVSIAVLISGCTDEKMAAGKIAEEMQKNQANITDYSARIHTELSFGDQTQIQEYDYAVKKPGKLKTVVRYPKESAGSTTVCNGNTTWVYDPGTNTVEVFKIPEMLATTEIDHSSIIRHYMNQSEITLDGVDKFEGRDAYVVTIYMKEKGKKGEELQSDMKVWFDEETWIPIKIEATCSIDGGKTEEYSYLVEYRNFKPNIGLDDRYFEYQIPKGVEVQIIDDYSDMTSGITLEQAQRALDFNILVPSYIPEGYKFETVLANNTHSDNTSQESAVIVYTNGKDTINIKEISHAKEKTAIQHTESGENVFVNDIEGKFFTLEYFNVLEWDTGILDISIESTLEKEEILKIADYMK